jgi:hypothetical protein
MAENTAIINHNPDSIRDMYHIARGPYTRDIRHDICRSKTDTQPLYMFYTYGTTGLRVVFFYCFQLSLLDMWEPDDGIVVELYDKYF